MKQLKPCPFCCTKGDLHERQIGFAVLCINDVCGNAFTNWHKNKIDAINQWNTRADGWISVNVNPQLSGRFTVDSSYGVRDAFFTEGFISGDFRWQDCQTGNDEGMEDFNGVEFKIYNWMPLPIQPVKDLK